MIELHSEVEKKHSRESELKRELKSIEKDEKMLIEKVNEVEKKLDAREFENRIKTMKEAITKAYLTLWFNSEGKTPTSVVIKLQRMGFKPARGKHDFVYDWGEQIQLEDVFKLGDAIHKTLKGSKVLYKLETP